MDNLTYYIRAFSKRLSGTVGLILLWRFLWPTIYKTLAAFARQDGTILGLFSYQDLNNQFWQVFFLLFLTLWFYRYVDGFLKEWEVAALKPHEAMVVAVRWLTLMLWHLLYPVIISLMMFWGLKHYTHVPHWLKIATAWLFFYVLLVRGWQYPREKVGSIVYKLTFQ